MPVVMKLLFVLVTGFAIMAAMLFAHWLVAVAIFVLSMFVYGRLRPYLVGPPTQQDYEELYQLFFSREWVKLADVSPSPVDVRVRTRAYARMLEAIPDITEARLRDATPAETQQVQAWRDDLERWFRTRGKYGELIDLHCGNSSKEE